MGYGHKIRKGLGNARTVRLRKARKNTRGHREAELDSRSILKALRVGREEGSEGSM